MPLLIGVVLDRANRADSGTVHQDVDAAELGHDLLDRRFERLPDIGQHREVLLARRSIQDGDLRPTGGH